MQDFHPNFIQAIQFSIYAGKAIMKVYAEDFSVMIKDDNSPLTKADQESNRIIVEGLSKSGWPVLSEEGKEVPYAVRKQWENFWMVDPLDGTKEFVKKNGEFTVNIAVINKTQPVFGVIYVPVTGDLYFGGRNFGSFKITNCQNPPNSVDELMAQAEKLPNVFGHGNYKVIGSRSHLSKETEDYFNEIKSRHGEISVVSKGSSLKLCLIAEGGADEYPRFAPTMEWDTAAGQAIIEGSGKRVIHYKSGKDLMYNKENLLNDWFIARSE